jgi:hypothetical protein
MYKTIGIAVAIAGVIASTTRAATQACRPQDNIADGLVATVKQHVTESSSTSFRAQVMKVPVLSPSDVTLVTDEAVCSAALQTYVTALPPSGADVVVTSVWVVRAGTHYLVTEPNNRAGEWARAIVVDSTYTKISGPFGM